MHYIFAADSKYHIYGLGGVNLSSTDTESNSEADQDSGVNIGLGGEYRLGSLSLYSELKYVISGSEQAVIAVGVRIPINGCSSLSKASKNILHVSFF